MRNSDLSRARRLDSVFLAFMVAIVMMGCGGGADTVVNEAGLSASASGASGSGSTPAPPVETPITPPPTETPAPVAPVVPPPVGVPIVPPVTPPVVPPVTPAPAPPVTPTPAPPEEPEPPPAGRPGPTNSAPIIAGVPPANARPGTYYSFKPDATDPDGDAITFAIANKPAWANFNSSSGVIEGTPTGGDVGTYSGIVISVSDGQHEAQLPDFNLAVVQVANGKATILWTPPTRNADGSALTDLAGYVIEYGTNASALDQSVRLTNPSLNTYLIADLLPGAWYFSVKAFNGSGAESDVSNRASKLVE